MEKIKNTLCIIMHAVWLCLMLLLVLLFEIIRIIADFTHSITKRIKKGFLNVKDPDGISMSGFFIN